MANVPAITKHRAQLRSVSACLSVDDTDGVISCTSSSRKIRDPVAMKPRLSRVDDWQFTECSPALNSALIRCHRPGRADWGRGLTTKSHRHVCGCAGFTHRAEISNLPERWQICMRQLGLLSLSHSTANSPISLQTSAHSAPSRRRPAYLLPAR